MGLKVIAADIILFVVGLLLVGGATTGIIRSGGVAAVVEETSASGFFNVTFPLQATTPAEKAVPSYQSGTADFDVNTRNVTKASFRIECMDGAPSGSPAYQITVRVEGPGGLSREGTGTCGQAFAVDVPVTNPPPAGNVKGDSESEARGNLARDSNESKAVGKWQVSFTGRRQQVPDPLQGAIAPPGGRIVNTLEVWTATLVAAPR